MKRPTARKQAQASLEGGRTASTANAIAAMRALAQSHMDHEPRTADEADAHGTAAGTLTRAIRAVEADDPNADALIIEALNTSQRADWTR